MGWGWGRTFAVLRFILLPYEESQGNRESDIFIMFEVARDNLYGYYCSSFRTSVVMS